MKETPVTDKQELPPGLIDATMFQDAMEHFGGEAPPDGDYEAPLQQAARDGYLLEVVPGKYELTAAGLAFTIRAFLSVEKDP